MPGADSPAISRRDWAILIAVAAVSMAVRLVLVNFPSRFVVDEYWYARDGCFYWRGSLEACRLAGLVAPDRDVATFLASYGELTPEHPPLAKWLIGAPMTMLDFTPGAWRLAAVAAGVITIGLLYLLVKRITGSTWAAAGASLLLAIDFSHVVHSRIAMLEIFVAMFAVAAFWFLTLDRQQLVRRAMGHASHRRWRLAAGVAAGGAAACKLSGVAVVLALVVLVTAWELSKYRGWRNAFRGVGREAPGIVLPLVIVPLATYMLTYVGRLDGSLLALPWSDGSWVHAWIERQGLMLGFHAAKPSVATPAWWLPMTAETIPYALERGDGTIRQVLLFGNPLLWWGGFAAVVLAAAVWLRGERSGSSGLVVIAFFASYAGWLSLTVTGRPVHLFHAVTVTPFLYVALAVAGRRVARWRVGRIAVIAVVASAVIAFAFYLPILIGLPLEPAQWHARACSASALWLDPLEECGTGAGTLEGPNGGGP